MEPIHTLLSIQNWYWKTPLLHDWLTGTSFNLWLFGFQLVARKSHSLFDGMFFSLAFRSSGSWQVDSTSWVCWSRTVKHFSVFLGFRSRCRTFKKTSWRWKGRCLTQFWDSFCMIGFQGPWYPAFLTVLSNTFWTCCSAGWAGRFSDWSTSLHGSLDYFMTHPESKLRSF